MPVAWEDITTSEFEAYVGQLDFRTEDGKAGVKRRCKLGFNLCVLTTRVAVDIAPEAGARDLNPAALDPKGHVIARLINRGRHGEAKYNLPPNARHAYWLVTAGKSRFVYVDRTGSLKVASTFEFRDCNDGHTSPNTGLEADFKQCPNEIGTTVGDETTDPAWISCLAGCCVAKTAFEGAARN